MLMSAYVNEQLTIKEGLFRESHVTPGGAGERHDRCLGGPPRLLHPRAGPAFPHRQHRSDPMRQNRVRPNQDTFPRRQPGPLLRYLRQRTGAGSRDAPAFKEFREEAERKKFRYFLEVFDPNVPSGISPEKLGEFINDNILRMLAGVPESGRPVFLKIVYHGPRAMEELAQYDPNLVVGILGGSAGTTYDAFKLIHDAQKYGARVALFGRKINNAEHQLAFIEMLRLITDGTHFTRGSRPRLSWRAARQRTSSRIAPGEGSRS